MPGKEQKPERVAKSDRRKNKKLSLWPLSVEEAATAILDVPPPPKEKAPKRER